MTSPSNVVTDPTQSLLNFTLDDLAQYTSEGHYAIDASTDFKLFYVGRDDVHDILKHVLSRVTTSLYLSMFGFDDEELNDILMAHAQDPKITMVITLDLSQAGGVHEKRLLETDKAKDLMSFNTHFVVGQSATHQINHTKGFVADGRVGGEGSTNWSITGEGTFVTGQTQAGGVHYSAQNNTQSVFTDRDTIARFSAQLINEHVIAQRQATARTPP